MTRQTITTVAENIHMTRSSKYKPNFKIKEKEKSNNIQQSNTLLRLVMHCFEIYL